MRRLRDLHDPADLGIAADDRVHLAVLRQLDQVAAVALERLVLVLGVLVGDALAAAHFLQRLQDLLLADPQRLEQGLSPALDLQEGQEQVLDRDVLVLHPLGLGLRGFEHLAELGADRGLAAGDLGQDVEPFLGGLQDLGGVDAELSQQRADDLLLGMQERGQQVHRLEPLMAALARQRLGLLHGFLALERELVETKGHGELKSSLGLLGAHRRIQE